MREKQQLTNVVVRLAKISSSGPTAKLWIQYFELISLVKLFIRAERTAGHLKYAKYAHVYVQDMIKLKQDMPEDEYIRFTKGGFTIRRNDCYWSGCWTDLIIEQELMRSIKCSGGLTRGRGITESTATQFISSQPACLEMIAMIENYSCKRAENSEQHKEMRDTRMERDQKDVGTLNKWLDVRNPFACSPELLISLSTGVAANTSINCHNAREVGEEVISKIVGHEISTLKLQHKDKVKNLTSVAQSIKIRDEVMCVDPTLLFSRILCLTPTPSDMKEYFSYELAPKAPALFDSENFMRKSCKSALATEIKRKVPCSEVTVPGTSYVLDGGFLLHYIVWNRAITYGDVINAYLSYVARSYTGTVTVIFDSYPNIPTTKDEEHRRRATSGTSAYIEFELPMLVTIEQERFLKNSCNKNRLILFLAEALKTAGHVVKHAESDADLLIVQTAIEKSSHREHVTVVGCKRAAFKCSPMCGYCKGIDCDNSDHVRDYGDEQGILQDDY
ncbi:hypothetical protein B566_EDAN015334 [Ephemera danica]|nr:hypothetical protein B566_EDAN015334 [Ephemera danica]